MRPIVLWGVSLTLAIAANAVAISWRPWFGLGVAVSTVSGAVIVIAADRLQDNAGRVWGAFPVLLLAGILVAYAGVTGNDPSQNHYWVRIGFGVAALVLLGILDRRKARTGDGDA